MLVTNIQMWRGRRRAWMLQCSGGAPGAKEGCLVADTLPTSKFTLEWGASVQLFALDLKARDRLLFDHAVQFLTV